jgi:formylglycine-generating enzyme required for sulfatase activity
MRGLRVLTFACAVMAAVPAFATELTIGPVTPSAAKPGDPLRVRFTVQWKNAWRTERNHDAAWIFVKVRAGSNRWQHGTIVAGATPVAEGRVTPRVEVPQDRAGFFVFPADAHRGDVAWTVEVVVNHPDVIRNDPDSSLEARAYGVEMVHVPQGPFTLGDPEPEALKFGAFYRSNASGAPDGLLRIESEDAIAVGATAGALNYQTTPSGYHGDAKGPVPAAFPKGFRAFWIMKYELTQGQYADFLNLLPDHPAAFRAIHAARGYSDQRGTIRFAGGAYVADKPHRPANFIAWSDAVAWTDWAGLRPLTDLEYTKAARGPSAPVAREFPWGSSGKERLRRVIQPDGDLASTGEADEAKLADDTREVFGASYYWVMDLAGSLWERVVTIGHPTGRAFTGSHGDGTLSGFGNATNEDWPRGDESPGGYGYRGGGSYARPGPPSPFLPHSPIGYRPYGSWGQGPRAIAYGYRAGRSAQQLGAVR